MLAETLRRLKGSSEVEVDVTPGAVYRHANGGVGVETAEVIDLARNGSGIAHVHFRVRITCGGITYVDENRILALESFRARYRDRVSAAGDR